MPKRLIVLVGVLLGIASSPAVATAQSAPHEVGVAGLSAALPAVMNAAYGGYTTAIYVENVSHLGQVAHVTITYYAQSGATVGAGDAATIPFWAEMTFRQDNGHSFAAGQAGSAIVTSDQEVAIFVNEFPPGSGTDGSSYTSLQLPTGESSALFAPAIARNAYGGYTTGIGLANTGTTTDMVAVLYRDATGSPVSTVAVSVPAHGFVGLYSGDPAQGLPDGFTGTAAIENVSTMVTQTLVAIVNETGPGGQFSSYDAIPAGVTTLYAPAAMHGAYGGFNTGFGIMNTSAAPGQFTITYYDATGMVAATAVKNIPGFGYLGVYQGGADGPPMSATAYTAVVVGTVPLAAIVNEVAPGGNQSTSFNTETAGSGYLNFALVENAGSDGWSTGLAIMNVTNAPITFTLTYFDAATGSGLSSIPLMLAAHAYMGRYTPGDLPAGTRATAWFFSATPGLAGIANEAGAGTFMSYNGQ